MKKFLPVLLPILLIGSLISGTLALYTQTQDLRGSISTRVLILKADAKPVSYEFGLNGPALAPGESAVLYRFDLTNASDANNICDFDMQVLIRSSGMAEASAQMKGLEFALYDESQEGSGPIATVSGDEMQVSSISFAKGVRKTIPLRITVTWRDTGDSASQTAIASSGKTFPIRIVITAAAEN